MSALTSAGSLCVGLATKSPQGTPSLASSRSALAGPRLAGPSSSRAASRQRKALTKRSAVVSASALGPDGDGNVKPVESREDFDKYVKEAGDKLVVLDIATKTCGPCKFIYPKVVQLSLERTDIVFLKIFGDFNQETRALMREWGVRAVPSFRFYKNGELIHSHSGAKEEDLRSNIQKHAPQAASV